MSALDAIESDTLLRVLVTRVDFGPGKLNGVALARMIRHKRPSVKTVIVGRLKTVATPMGQVNSCRTRSIFRPWSMRLAAT